MLFFTGNPLSVISNHGEIVLLIISDKILSFALELNKIKVKPYRANWPIGPELIPVSVA